MKTTTESLTPNLSPASEHRGFFGYDQEQHTSVQLPLMHQRFLAVLICLEVEPQDREPIGETVVTTLSEHPHPTYADQLAYLRSRYDVQAAADGATWLDNLHPSDIWSLYLDDTCQRLEDQ